MWRMWNDADRGKLKYFEKKLNATVHHRFHMDRPGIEPDFYVERPATIRLSHDTPLSSGVWV